MFYCPGEYCSRRNECIHNKLDTSGKLQQWLGLSTEGSGYGGIDANGKYLCHHEYCCGDRAADYMHFVPISKED